MLITEGNLAVDLRNKIDSKYQEVNDLWKDIKIPYITRQEAEKAKNILIRKFGAKKFLPPFHSAMNPKAYRVFKPYICLSGDPTTLWKGWRRLIHSLSHKVYRRRFPQRWFDHSYQQAELELEMCKFVIDKGWLDQTLKSKVIIIAHSMGGLVTRKYLADFGDDDVAKVIIVGQAIGLWIFLW
jgi:triacylglycerol esterase/lipase EstA (alpha/beta hydrolase family)